MLSGKVAAQSMVTGHATAEIIEAVTLTSDAVTELSYTQGETMNLGAISVGTGSKDITCDIILEGGLISSEDGSSFTLQPTVSYKSITGSQGPKKVALSGSTSSHHSIGSGTYSGSYTVVMAYN